LAKGKLHIEEQSSHGSSWQKNLQGTSCSNVGRASRISGLRDLRGIFSQQCTKGVSTIVTRCPKTERSEDRFLSLCNPGGTDNAVVLTGHVNARADGTEASRLRPAARPRVVGSLSDGPSPTTRSSRASRQVLEAPFQSNHGVLHSRTVSSLAR